MRRPHLTTSPLTHDHFFRYETACALATELNDAITLSRADEHFPWPAGTGFTEFGGFPGWWTCLAECAAVFDQFQVDDEDWLLAIRAYAQRIWNETLHIRAPLSSAQLTLLMGLVVEAILARHTSQLTASDTPPHTSEPIELRFT